MTHLTEFPESQHPAEERLSAFAAGDLIDAELEKISEHVAQCDACCARLASINHCDPLESRLAAVLTETPEQEFAAPVATDVLRWLAGSCGSEEAHKLAQAAVPQEVLQYRIIREVARGGMGVVYEAEDVNLHRRVAIKMILAGEFSSSEMRIRFRREAELQSRIQHPGMIQVFEIGEYRGLPFLAMEWIDGGTLADQIKLRKFDPKEASLLLRQLAEAVHAAHLQGVIHRDLKSSNILLSARGPLLSDFGIAFRPADDFRLTVSGVLSGTPEYTAPELGVGKSRLASVATDVYALGVILYEMISGQCPFHGATGLETLRKASADSLVPLRRHRPDVPTDLDVIVSKCLEKQPASRYSSAAALADDLEAFLEGRPIQAREVGAMERAWRWCRRSPIIASLLLALFLAILAGSTLSIWFAVIASEHATEADRLAKHSLEIAGVARTAQLRAEKAESMARERASDAMSVLLETAWNAGDARKFMRYLQTATEGQAPRELPFEQRLLSNRLDSGYTLLHHGVEVFTSACKSRDGKTLFAGTLGAGILEFDLHSETYKKSLERHPSQLNDLILSRDETRLYGADAHGHLVTWDVDTGRIVSVQKLHEGEVLALGVLNDGNFVTAGLDGSVLIVTPDMKVERVLRKDLSFPSLTLSSSGDLMAISSRSGVVEILNALSFEPVGSCSNPGCIPREMKFSHSGRLLAIAGVEGTVSILQVDPEPEIIESKPVCSGEIVSLKWSRDDSLIAVGSVDQRAMVLSSETLSTAKTYIGHVATASCVDFHGANDNELLSCGFDSTIRIWGDQRNPNPQRSQLTSNGMSQVDFAAMERLGSLDLSDIKVLTQLISLCDAPVQCLAVSDDASVAAAGGLNGCIYLINLSTMTIDRRLQTTHGAIYCLRFLNEYKHLASSGDDGVIRVWNLETGESDAEMKEHRGTVRTLAILPKQRHLVSGGDDSRIILWDLDEHRFAGELTGHRDKVFDLAVSKNGELYSASEDGTVRLWDVATQTERQQFTGHVGPVRCVDISPDGSRVASGGWDQSVILWNCRTGQQVARLEDHDREISDLSFSRDGRALTSIGYSGEVVRWYTAPR